MKPLTFRTLEWIDQAPVRVQATRTLPASPDAVWAVLADHAAWPQWFTAIKSVVPKGDGTGVGGGRVVTLSGMQFDEEFLAWEPGRLFAFTVTAMNRPLFASLVERIELAPDGAGTKVTYTQGFEPKFLSGLVLKVAKGQLHKALDQGLQALGERAAAST